MKFQQAAHLEQSHRWERYFLCHPRMWQPFQPSLARCNWPGGFRRDACKGFTPAESPWKEHLLELINVASKHGQPICAPDCGMHRHVSLIIVAGTHLCCVLISNRNSVGTRVLFIRPPKEATTVLLSHGYVVISGLCRKLSWPCLCPSKFTQDNS